MKKSTSFLQLLFQQLFYAACHPLMRFFVRLEVEGREHLESLDGGFILAANHVSELDPAFVRAALPFFSGKAPVYFASNTKERYSAFGWRSLVYGGRVFELFGAYPVYKGQNDYALAVRHHAALLSDGRTICIFPEGKRSQTGELGSARGGVAYLSHAHDAPVVPVAITGLAGIGMKDFFLRKRAVRVHIGRPLASREVVPAPIPSVEDYKRGAELVLLHIKGLLENSGVESTVTLLASVEQEEFSNISYE